MSVKLIAVVAIIVLSIISLVTGRIAIGPHLGYIEKKKSPLLYWSIMSLYFIVLLLCFLIFMKGSNNGPSSLYPFDPPVSRPESSPR
jgi:hypothetical protein